MPTELVTLQDPPSRPRLSNTCRNAITPRDRNSLVVSTAQESGHSRPQIGGWVSGWHHFLVLLTSNDLYADQHSERIWQTNWR